MVVFRMEFLGASMEDGNKNGQKELGIWKISESGGWQSNKRLLGHVRCRRKEESRESSSQITGKIVRRMSLIYHNREIESQIQVDEL